MRLIFVCAAAALQIGSAMGTEATSDGWEAKDAYRKCESAVSGAVQWPSHPQNACRAMHLCANEANLPAEQYGSLVAAIRRLPNCGDP